MNVKKLLAMLSAVTLTFSATAGYFPAFSSGNHFIRASAEDISPPSIEITANLPSAAVAKASAEDAETSSDGWEYYEEDGGITISGYSGTATELVIPDEIDGQPVIAIADEAFSGNRRLVSLKLGNVVRLGYKFLEGCIGITEITIPRTVTDSWFALEGSSVENVTFEEGIANIPAYICGAASSVKSVTLPEKEDTLDGYCIGESAFVGTSITSITIPESVTEIKDHAFSDCALLTSVVIPDNVTSIGEGCFEGCKRLKSISFGKSVQSLGYKFLNGCVGITEITIPKTVTDSWYALEGSSIESVTFEEGIANIPAYICGAASSVKSVTLPEKEDTLDGYFIGEGAFSGTSITSITIPESVTEIKDHAFSECALLTAVVIPDNVTSIGEGCFEGCKRLKSISFGKSVQSLGYKFLNGCVSITDITIPKTVTDSWYALEGSSIENVTFEEGIANIPAYICGAVSSVKSVTLPEKEDTLDGYFIGEGAFSGTSITSITIPESVTEIKDHAFSDCALLTAVVIPDNVTSIGEGCFEGCKRLKSISVGKSVQSLGYKFLNGCVGITDITIPKTVTDSWYALEGSSIETLIIESGMKTTPEYLAAECTTLRTVYLPDTVSEIGDYSFAGCKNLEKVKSNRSTFNFSAHSFEGCVKLDDSRFTVLDLENTYLSANSEQANVNGIINYTLKYKLMPSVAASADNLEIHINMPEGLTLLLDSVQSKNLNYDPEDIEDGVISVNSTEGELRFTARVTEVGDYEVSATLNFDYNNSWWEQTIGRLDVDCPDITIAVPENVNEFTAEVYGIAQRNQDVEIYVNDTIAGTFTANEHTGKYKGSVVLPAGKDGEVYSIYAQCGNMTSDIVKTTYSSLKPVVKKVLFGYNDHQDELMDITDVLTRGTSPVISFNPAYPISFEITATNNERIDRLFVTSTKGNIDKYIEAFYNAQTGTWIAEGYFDDSNHSYVPGSLNVSIIEKETVILDDNYDYEADQTLDNISQEYIDNSSVDIISESDNSVLANVTVSNGISSNSFQMYSSENNEGIYIGGEYYSAETIAKNPEKYGFTNSGVKTIENGKAVTYYTLDSDNDDIVATMLLDGSADLKNINDVWTGKAFLKMIEGDLADHWEVQLANKFITDAAKPAMKELFGESYGTISKGLSFGSDTLKYAAQLEMANGDPEYVTAATLLYGIKCFNTFGGTDLVLAHFGIVPPYSTVIKFAIGKGLDWADNYLMDCMKNNKHFLRSGHLRFIIDPSGIVFEAVIGNPIEGATVTVYFKDAETGETVKWNAEDYDQLNPLLTDKEGKYLWDVPEGEWKVVCEKEGYETVETDWMGIPPVRTDVNLSLVNKDAPELVSADMGSDGITVKFSKFVDITTVTPESVVIDGFNGTYAVAPQLLGEDDKYADTFILSGDFTNEITAVSVTSDVLSYAGTPAEAAEISVTDSRISKGDVNGDGTVNLKDVVMIRRYIAGGWNVTINESIADVNGDGNVNLKDVVMIRRYIAGGWDVELNTAA